VEIADTCCYTVVQQLRAAAAGVPFLPVRSMRGTGFPGLHPEYLAMKCPFTGDDLLLVPALAPDVALIHAQYGDSHGNLRIVGPPVADLLSARASKKVIATVERIVTNDELQALGGANVPYFTSPQSPKSRWVRIRPPATRSTPTTARTPRSTTDRPRPARKSFVRAISPHTSSIAATTPTIWSASAQKRLARACVAGAMVASLARALRGGRRMIGTCTLGEAMIHALARTIEDGTLVFHGFGSPLVQLAMHVAKRTHAPDMALIAGATYGLNPHPPFLTPTSNDWVLDRGAECSLDIEQLFDLGASGRLGRMFLSGVQIDRWGNANVTRLGRGQLDIKLPGGGGGCNLSCDVERLTLWTTATAAPRINTANGVSGWSIGATSSPTSATVRPMGRLVWRWVIAAGARNGW